MAAPGPLPIGEVSGQVAQYFPTTAFLQTVPNAGSANQGIAPSFFSAA